MTNYEQLVKALRCFKPLGECIESKCKYLWSGCSCNELQLQRDAADAIEALQAQLPKRGEWVDGDNFEDPFLGKFRCSVCGHAVQAIEYNYEQKTVRFASGKTEYCPNCGAKMEVQE